MKQSNVNEFIAVKSEIYKAKESFARIPILTKQINIYIYLTSYTTGNLKA